MGADGSPGLSAHPWRVAAAQVFVEDLGAPELVDTDARHLRDVLRLSADELVCAADANGGWRLCRLVGDELVVESEEEVADRPEPLLTVGFAPVKGDRPEWAVQKLTEVGVDRILVLRCSRSVVRWQGDKAERHLAKLRRTALEAARQCRRLWIPEVAMSDLDAVPSAVLADAGGRPVAAADHAILVGPEGGWANDEREARDSVALAGDILRAETAAVVAGAAMAALRLGLSAPGLS